MQGGTALHGSPGTTFQELQQQVASAATTYAVDPTTGRAWDVATLLKRASGDESWLGAGNGANALQRQIEQVLALTDWRRGDAFAPGQPGSESTVTRTAYAHAADCPFSSAGYTPAPELRSTWTQLFPQALRAKGSTYGGGVLGTMTGWSVQGGQFNGSQIAGPVASVFVGRDLWRLPLVVNAPVPGIPVDDARLLFAETAYQDSGAVHLQLTHGLQQLRAVAVPVTVGRQFSVVDYDLAGTTIVGYNTTPVPGAVTAVWNLPLGVILRPGTNGKNPQLAPALLLNISMKEPPAGFPPAGPLLGSCLWGPSVTLTSPVLIYQEAFPRVGAAPKQLAPIPATAPDKPPRPLGPTHLANNDRVEVFKRACEADSKDNLEIAADGGLLHFLGKFGETKVGSTGKESLSLLKDLGTQVGKVAEPIVKTIGRATSVVFYVGAYWEWTCANDPPDPNYTALTHAQAPPGFLVQAGPGMPAAVASALNPLLVNARDSAGTWAALIASLQRAEGADTHGDAHWEKAQSAAAAASALSAAKLLDAAPRLRATLATALRRSGIRFSLPARGVDAVEKTLATSGLPKDTTDLLRLLGVPPAGIAAARRDIGRTITTSHRISALTVPGFLTGGKQAAADKSLARSLRALASLLEHQ